MTSTDYASLLDTDQDTLTWAPGNDIATHSLMVRVNGHLRWASVWHHVPGTYTATWGPHSLRISEHPTLDEAKAACQDYYKFFRSATVSTPEP